MSDFPEAAAHPAAPPVPGPLTTFQAILEVLNRRHVLLLILLLADRGPQRFTQLQNGPGNLSPKTLAMRLQDLASVGLVVRRAFREMPPRVEYDLTGKGRALVPLYQDLYEWHLKHEGAPVECPQSDRLLRRLDANTGPPAVLPV